MPIALNLKEWDDGVHLLLFAAREVVQESTGFSPADLVFAHNVRGPLKLLRENWLNESKPQNLLDYVSYFRYKLHRACELATQNLSAAQSKMKGWFDKKAMVRQFKPGDKVLMFLPIPGSSLQARYSGPYVIEKRVSDRDYSSSSSSSSSSPLLSLVTSTSEISHQPVHTQHTYMTMG